MRRILGCLALIIFAQYGTANGTPPATPQPQCPTISVNSESEVLCPGARAIFTARGAGVDPNLKLTFHWTVSSGEIISGQGTTAIMVAAEYPTPGGGPQDEGITATFTVGVSPALPSSCQLTASYTVRKAICCLRKFDEYGDIAFEDEKARLDNFAIPLKEEPRSLGYILAYAGRRARVNEARARLERAKNYLVNERGIEAERIVLIDGGHREELTVELWPLPSDAPPITPDTSTTIDPREVEIIPDLPEETGQPIP